MYGTLHFNLMNLLPKQVIKCESTIKLSFLLLPRGTKQLDKAIDWTCKSVVWFGPSGNVCLPNMLSKYTWYRQVFKMILDLSNFMYACRTYAYTTLTKCTIGRSAARIILSRYWTSCTYVCIGECNLIKFDQVLPIEIRHIVLSRNQNSQLIVAKYHNFEIPAMFWKKQVQRTKNSWTRFFLEQNWVMWFGPQRFAEFCNHSLRTVEQISSRIFQIYFVNRLDFAYFDIPFTVLYHPRISKWPSAHFRIIFSNLDRLICYVLGEKQPCFHTTVWLASFCY